MSPKFIAVDFDGTCVTHEYPKVGRDIGAVPVLKLLADKGHRLILFTMRSGDALQEAVAWFAAHDIPLYAINDNPDQLNWTNSRKIYAHLYIDDAAIGAPLLEGLEGERPFIWWDEVQRLLTIKHGLL